VAAGTKQWTRHRILRFQCLKDLKLRREGEKERRREGEKERSEVWWWISKQG
jgi:hypothetical protein